MDFIKLWKENVSNSSLRGLFHIVELSDFHGKEIQSLVDLDQFITSGKFHFGILGETKMRNHMGSPHLFLEEQAIVKHGLIQKTISDEFSNQLQKIFPSRLIFPEKADYLVIESSSKSISLICKYMLAVAAYFTRDFQLSLAFLSEIEQSIGAEATGSGIPALRTYVKERIPACLFCLSQVHHYNWRKTKDVTQLTIAKDHAVKLKEYPGFKYHALCLLAIQSFVIDNDVGEAKRLLKEAKKMEIKEPNPDLGLAFLYAYENRLDKAQARYAEAMRYGVNAVTSIEIEEFIEWVLVNSPEKYQLYYCLGFINCEFKKDSESGKADFVKYLEKATEPADTLFINKAKAYLSQS